MSGVDLVNKGRQRERDAWLRIVKPNELDSHMASIGQAEANASIVREMLHRFRLADDSKLLVHGCGSCQVFDYIPLSDFGKIRITFADLSSAMFEEARKRLEGVSDASYEFVIDDMEDSCLTGSYDAIMLVLVLLHVDWQLSLKNMLRHSPSLFFIIEQEQLPGVPSVTSTDGLPPSIRRYSEVAEMELVPRNELVSFMGSRGYSVRWTTTRPVPGEKSMMGFVFGRG